MKTVEFDPQYFVLVRKAELFQVQKALDDLAVEHKGKWSTHLRVVYERGSARLAKWLKNYKRANLKVAA